MRNLYLLSVWLIISLFFLVSNNVLGQTNKANSLNNSQRHALVIGNNSYPNLPLDNPINDADKVSDSLEQVGFKVTIKYDLNILDMRKVILEFGEQIPKNGIGLFFYAGHGIQVGGRNFLLPIDFSEVKDKEKFLKEMIDLESIVSAISKKSGLTIIILDACRNRPKDLSLSFGVDAGFSAFKQTGSGTYIAYSTSPNKTAADGDNGNSPYSAALAKNLLMNPGRIEDIFIKTRIDVENATAEGQVQTPWENGALKTVFYFRSSNSKTNAIPVRNKNSIAPNLKPKLPYQVSSLELLSFSSPILSLSGRRKSILNEKSSYFRERFRKIDLEMIEIKGGEFSMGSNYEDVEAAYKDLKRYNDEALRQSITAEMPQHSVRVPGFFMSKNEITQGQWRSVIGSLPEGIPPNMLGENLPIINVGWDDAVKFCDTLSEETGRNYSLPTEAEWEYAAKAGKDQQFPYGENINTDVANYFGGAFFGDGKSGEIRGKTLPVGSLKATNPFGLHDMSGNVWEWTLDYWNNDYSGAPIDGGEWEDGDENFRVVRGGSWDNIANSCRTTHRRKQPAVYYSSLKVGFRVVVRN